MSASPTISEADLDGSSGTGKISRLFCVSVRQHDIWLCMRCHVQSTALPHQTLSEDPTVYYERPRRQFLMQSILSQ